MSFSPCLCPPPERRTLLKLTQSSKIAKQKKSPYIERMGVINSHHNGSKWELTSARYGARRGALFPLIRAEHRASLQPQHPVLCSATFISVAVCVLRSKFDMMSIVPCEEQRDSSPFGHYFQLGCVLHFW